MKVFGIISGKGGVGKTTTVANLGMALSDFGRDVILIDGNLLTPNLAFHFGIFNYASTFLDVLRKRSTVSSAIHYHESGVKIIPSEPSLYSIRIASKTLKSFLDGLSSHEFVLIDSAPGIESEILPISEVCDELLIITNPDVPSVMDAKRTLIRVKEKGARILGIELNRVRRKKWELSIDEIESICDAPVISVVPESIEIQQALALGKPAVLAFPYCSASIEFKKVGANLFGSTYRPSLVERLKWKLHIGRKKPKFVPLERPPEKPVIEKPPEIKVERKKIPPEISEEESLEKYRRKIEESLSRLEEFYKEGKISEKAYKEMRAKSEAELRDIESKLG